jgi:hypothetical protein
LGEDDFVILDDNGRLVGRIYKDTTSPRWIWSKPDYHAGMCWQPSPVTPATALAANVVRQHLDIADPAIAAIERGVIPK